MIKNTVIIGLAIGVLFLIFMNECRGPKIETVIEYDTIYGEPDTVKIIEHLIIEKPVYITKYLTPDTVYTPAMADDEWVLPPTIREYSDSLCNDSICIAQWLKVEGKILSWNMKYWPMINTRETTIEVPSVVTKTEYKRELFLSGMGGGGATWQAGLGLDMINKKRNIYGVYATYTPHGWIIGGRIGKKLGR